MSCVEAFAEGRTTGIRPFRAAWRPLLTGGLILIVTCLAVLLLKAWALLSAVVVITGCLVAAVYFIYAWIALFMASGFLDRS
jgi:hypothetical protein